MQCLGRQGLNFHMIMLHVMVSSAALIAATPASTGRNWSVAVLVAPGFYLIDAMGPLDVFRAVQLKAFANVNLTLHEYRPDLPPSIVANGSLHVDVLAPSTGPVRASDGIVIQPDASIAKAPRERYDLVVVPAGADGAEIDSFLLAHYAAGGAIMSVCVGSDILASLGLLDGREATTNSLLLWRSRKQWPMVRWVDLRDDIDRRFIVSQPPERILTTAGVTAGIDGALHYVSSWFGQHVAEAVREFVEWPLPLEQRVRTLH